MSRLQADDLCGHLLRRTLGRPRAAARGQSPHGRPPARTESARAGPITGLDSRDRIACGTGPPGPFSGSALLKIPGRPAFSAGRLGSRPSLTRCPTQIQAEAGSRNTSPRTKSQRFSDV